MAGRPLKFQNAQELQEKIDKFFEYCDIYNKLPTITRMAWYLDTSRETLKDYEFHRGDDFSDTVARAKEKVQLEMEDLLYNKHSARGAEFTLKNNFGWRDEQHIEQDLRGKMEQEVDFSGASPQTLKELKKILESNENLNQSQ